MDPSRWQQIEEIFQSALDLEQGARSRFLSETCDGDALLRLEVEKLIAQYEESDDFIESPVWTNSSLFNSNVNEELKRSFGNNNLDETPDPLIGQRLGAYRLTRELGRGGMGAVYLGERVDGEFSHRVAVKLIKRGMDTDFVVRRFRHERQILAALDHANIARLLDGGTTTDHLPFFVMEFIEGEPLYQYCDARKLIIRERLLLFQQICAAVAYAHEKQIIHRDIKPSNILVTAAGVPKLLDFGIAKILDPELIHESINPTSTLMRLMTPEYASPEQVRGLTVTPASDVYALGVLLYELLTGHRPYSFAGRSAHEISRVICEFEPEFPSLIAKREENLLPQYAAKRLTAERSAQMRSTSVEILQTELSGDLDNLVLKTLCKKAEDRYVSVAALSEDLSRYLSGNTVLADPCQKASPSEEKLNLAELESENKSLAVLPFKLLTQITGEETGDKFLGVGLADALITRLSNIRRLIVRPTSSVVRYGGENAPSEFLDPIEAGRELGVEFILDGRIQKSGPRIRVSVQLLNVRDRAAIWAERFDEQFTDVLNLEDTISKQVATALVPKISGAEREQLAKRGTEDHAAFEAYLRGRYHLNSFTEEGFAKAIVAFNQAVAFDPNYALAHAGIADYYIWLGVYGIMPPHECFMAAKDAALKAIELDEKLSDGHAALGFAILAADFEWNRSEEHLRRALHLNPNNALACARYSYQLTMEGRFDEAVKQAEHAIRLDPITPFNQHCLGWSLYYARRFDESVAQYQKLIDENPLYGLGHFAAAWVLRFVGRYEEALSAMRRAQELSNNSLFMLFGQAQALAAAGKREEVSALLQQIEKIAETRYISQYQIAIIYAFLGGRKKALAALEQAMESRESWLVWMGVEPVFDSLRSEVGFVNLLERTGNPIFFRAKTIELEDSTAPLVHTINDQSKLSRQSRQLKIKRKSLATASVAVFAIAISVFVAARAGWITNFGNLQSSNIAAMRPVSNNGNAVERAKNFRSIAVLPFTTIDSKSDDEQYLGVGTADLIANKLSELKEINLRSASSVRRYLNTTKSMIEVGRELAVDYIVSGSVERAENQVSARLNLIEVESGKTVFSENFIEPNNSLFELQDTISGRIANSLSLRLTKAEQEKLEKHFTENNEAYQLYLAGRYHFGKRTVEGLRQAIALFEQAIKLDSNFALAYTGLADCNALLNWYQEPPPPGAWRRAQQAVLRAVQQDADLAEAHVSLAFIKFHYERDFGGAENEFLRAIELKPNYATAHQWYAFLLSAEGRHDEAIARMKMAETLDPRSAVIASGVANVLYHARRFDDSIAQCQHALELDPGSISTHVILRWNYEKKGLFQNAFNIYEKERAFAGETPTTRAKLAHVQAAAGRFDEARRALSELQQTRQIEHITPYEIAVIYALLNDQQTSLDWLRKAKDSHAVGFSFVSVDPHLDNLRETPQFANLVN